MAPHEHHHGHDDRDRDHEHGSALSETQRRVRALETILTEKGYVDPAALDVLIETYETKVGPRRRDDAGPRGRATGSRSRGAGSG